MGCANRGRSRLGARRGWEASLGSVTPSCRAGEPSEDARPEVTRSDRGGSGPTGRAVRECRREDRLKTTDTTRSESQEQLIRKEQTGTGRGGGAVWKVPSCMGGGRPAVWPVSIAGQLGERQAGASPAHR